jgi:muramidase (phage lysozyme)
MPAKIADTTLPARVQAFLMMIQKTEGTALYNNPYTVLFGGGSFSGYAKHPKILVPHPKWPSTAAGAYQILYATSKELNMTDFTPVSQDRAAVKLIKKQGAYNDVLNGNITSAINKVKKRWASFPGAGYGQPERKLSELIAFYNATVLNISGGAISGMGGAVSGTDSSRTRTIIIIVLVIVLITIITLMYI